LVPEGPWATRPQAAAGTRRAAARDQAADSPLTRPAQRDQEDHRRRHLLGPVVLCGWTTDGLRTGRPAGPRPHGRGLPCRRRARLMAVLPDC
jgi:hypothetical protein